MAERTCSAEGCDRPAIKRGMCNKHYQRARTTGQWKDGVPCKGCGQPVDRTTAPARTSSYCSPACYPTCAVDGCDKRRHSGEFCTNHYERWRRCGDPEAPFERLSNAGLPCEAPGCARPRRKRTWCEVHYNQWRLTGRTFPIKPWTTDFVCVVCGEETGKIPGRRKFCSANCAQLYHTHGGQVPMAVPCVSCGKDIDLRDGRNGRRKRFGTKLCRRCRQDSRKHGMSVEQLATRDGLDCGICGEAVDMGLGFPDLMRPSVDHIKPRARGGSNDPSNLQLAHLLCNCRKSSRYEVDMT